MHRFKHVTHPDDVLLVVRRLAPAPDNLEEEGCGPVADWRLIVADAADGAAERPNDQHGSGGGPHGGATQDGVKRLVCEAIEVDGLPIMKELALAKKRIVQLL